MKTIYAYSFAVLVLVISSSSARINFNYNFTKIQYTRSAVQRMENQSWIDETRSNCSYDEQKRLIELNEENISAVSWATYSRTNFFYSGSSLDSIHFRSWNPEESSDKVTICTKYTYTSSGLLSSVSAVFNIDGNTLSSHAILTYDNQGRIIADTIYEIDSLGTTKYYNVYTYALGSKTKIGYNSIGDYWSKDSTVLNSAGHDSISYGFSSVDSGWKAMSKTEWIYTGGQVTMELYSDWNGSAFILSRRTLFEYENSASATSSLVRNGPNLKKGKMIMIGRRTSLHQNAECLNLLGRMLPTQRTIGQGIQMYMEVSD